MGPFSGNASRQSRQDGHCGRWAVPVLFDDRFCGRSGTEPVQEQNKILDKRRNILQVAGLYKEGIDVNEALKAIEPRLVDIASGKFSDAEDAATYDQRTAAKIPAQSVKLKDDPASIGRQAKLAAVYLIRNEAGDIEKIILPVHGYGLWSTLYGFVASQGPMATKWLACSFTNMQKLPALVPRLTIRAGKLSGRQENIW